MYLCWSRDQHSDYIVAWGPVQLSVVCLFLLPDDFSLFVFDRVLVGQGTVSPIKGFHFTKLFLGKESIFTSKSYQQFVLMLEGRTLF